MELNFLAKCSIQHVYIDAVVMCTIIIVVVIQINTTSLAAEG